MEIRKCIQCGGNLKRLRVQRIWQCPYCGARYEDDVQEIKAAPAEYFGLNKEVFKVERDLSETLKNPGGAGCIQSIIHCMETFETADQVEKYMLRLPFSDDISVKGIREDQIQKAMPVLNTVMDLDERVIVYGNKGIFSKGKEYFAITNKRTVFVRKSDIKEVLHTDIDSIKIENCGNCYINGDYDKGLVNLDANGRFQGVIIAFMCMISFEEDPDRERIQIL